MFLLNWKNGLQECGRLDDNEIEAITLMYADDTTLHCNINQNISEIEINHELWKVSQWLAANKLSLNVGKTKFMVFRMRNKVVSYPDSQINGNAIKRVTQFNF